MSLIDEALKRAQGIESAEEAVRRGAAYPFMARNLQDRRRSRRALLLGFLAGGVLAFLLAGGIVLWLAARRAPEPAVRAAAKPPAPSAVAAPLPEVVVPPPVAVRAAPPQAAPETRPARGAVPSAPRPGMVPPKPSSASAPAAARGVEPPASALGILDGKAYPGAVALSDGRRIELEGIVYSETSPVAMINGRVLGVGGTVEEFAIARVAEDRVELRGRGIAFTILLK